MIDLFGFTCIAFGIFGGLFVAAKTRTQTVIYTILMLLFGVLTCVFHPVVSTQAEVPNDEVSRPQ